MSLKKSTPELDQLETFLELIDWIDDMGVLAVAPSADTLSPSVPSPMLTVAFVDRFMRPGRNRLVAYDASEGALHVLALAVLALHPRVPRLLAIDNFDQSMNPRLARAATRLLCQVVLASSPSRQILLTTHNPLVLDGLDLGRDDVRLFTVDRDSDGVTDVQRVVVSDELIDEARNGMPLSRLWVSGRLGGMPNV